MRDFPTTLAARPPTSVEMSAAGRLPSPLGSPSTILAATSILRTFGPLFIQFVGPPHAPSSLHPPGQSGVARLACAAAAGAAPAPVVGLPWKRRPREGGLVGKRSWEVSQRELSADGFVIGHKTGAFRFVNQSRLSHSINVRFIGSKKALCLRPSACLFEHGHSQDPKRVWAFEQNLPGVPPCHRLFFSSFLK